MSAPWPEPDGTTREQATFIRRLAEAHDRIRKAIAGLDEPTAEGEFVLGDWTVKDILGHIVSWNDEFRIDILAILRNENPGYEHQIDAQREFDETNQRWVSGKRARTWAMIVADLERGYREARNLILALRPEDFRRRGVTPWKPAARSRPEVPTSSDTDSVRTLVTYHWRHLNDHARALERWRAKRSQTVL